MALQTEPIDGEFFVRSALGLAEVVRPMVVGIAQLDGGLYGSGLLARSGEQHCVLTAGHLKLAEDHRSGRLALVTRVTSGVVLVGRDSEVVETYVDDGPVVDMGIIKLSPRTATAITAWTDNRWFPLTSGHDRPPARDLSEPGRVFFTTGFPKSLSAVESNKNSHTLQAKYFVLGAHLAEPPTEDETLAFDLGNEGIDLSNGEHVPRRQLSGLSGAPVWTANRDLERSGGEILLVGFHSGSNAERTRVVRWANHIRVMRDSGWLP